MRRRVFVAVVVIGLVFATTGAFAKQSGFAIGAEAASNNFNGWGGRLVLHLPVVPLYFGVGAIVESGATAVDVTADYWFLHNRLSGLVDYYVGIGGYLAFGTGGASSFALGARLPIGLQIWPVGSVLEIFLEAAPAWIPLNGNGTNNLLTFAVQPAIGFRIWL